MKEDSSILYSHAPCCAGAVFYYYYHYTRRGGGSTQFCCCIRLYVRRRRRPWRDRLAKASSTRRSNPSERGGARERERVSYKTVLKNSKWCADVRTILVWRCHGDLPYREWTLLAAFLIHIDWLGSRRREKCEGMLPDDIRGFLCKMHWW